MKKLIVILFITAFATSIVVAQQIKRSTLTSVGKLKVAAPFRVSWTAGSCPGCNVLHPDNPPNSGYLRQGFQQPPSNGNSPNCPPLTPTFTINPVVTPLCGTKFDFEFTGTTVPNMVVEWDFGTGAVPQTSRDLNPAGVIYTTTGIKVITFKVSSGTCSDSRARTVDITNPQIGFRITPVVTDVKCRNEKSGSINITTQSSSAARTYRWSNGATTQNLTNVLAGRYSVTATDANGCVTSLDTVIGQPKSELSFTSIVTPETCKDYEDGQIQLNVSGGTKPYKLSWSNGATSSNISALIAGKYTVAILDTNNCRIDTAFVVNRRCRTDTSMFQIYNIISPNGDGINDTWVIANIEKYPNNELFIYNRWGQLVYTTKAYIGNWAGTNQDGKDLTAGAYFYVVRLNDDKNTIWDGSVTVLR